MECGTVGFATFEGYDDPTSFRREVDESISSC